MKFNYVLFYFINIMFIFYYALSVEADISLQKGLFIYSDSNGNIINKKGSLTDSYFIPASIIKIATGSYALFTFGDNYRFSTRFYRTSDNDLVIKGFGDPGFTSEELRSAIQNISLKHKSFRNIILDDTFYGEYIEIPGRGNTNNPYDAPVGALAINFNTVSVIKDKNNKIISGETETPLTRFAKDIAMSLPIGKHRVRVGGSPSSGLQHLAELTKIFLNKEGVKISDNYLIKKTPLDSKLIHEHKSSKTLEENVKDMLRYSNNFIANQLFLVTSAYYSGPPVKKKNAEKYFRKFLEEEMNFEGYFKLEEGAGLSRKNQLNIDQIISMLKYFKPYLDLLPEESGLYYKSGSLNGISNLAGYYLNRNKPYMFVLLEKANRPIPERIKRVKLLSDN